jgi:hypothetical protein
MADNAASSIWFNNCNRCLQRVRLRHSLEPWRSAFCRVPRSPSSRALVFADSCSRTRFKIGWLVSASSREARTGTAMRGRERCRATAVCFLPCAAHRSGHSLRARGANLRAPAVERRPTGQPRIDGGLSLEASRLAAAGPSAPVETKRPLPWCTGGPAPSSCPCLTYPVIRKPTCFRTRLHSSSR